MSKTKALLAAALCVLPSLSSAKIQIVTTTEDLAALAREVGGGQVEAQTIAKGYEDPHFVQAKPSYLLKLKRADLFIQVGLELEVAWAGALLTSARNTNIIPGNPGFLDASESCEVLEKPQSVDRSLGDVHPLGNPHYWLDPANGRIIASRIAQRLEEIDSSHAAEYRSNLAAFEKRLNEKSREWALLAQPLKGLGVVTYHNSWPNFARRFGLRVVNFIEPRPGIPPSPAHVQSLEKQMAREKIALILVEPYFDDKLPRKIAEDTGAHLVILPPSVGAVPDIKTYFGLFDHDLKLILGALGKSAAKS
ncbi:MAG: zinc ABC transporter substrate-binding protein [Elusimicrobia bacterium]|nr:zinc ABC transporter substrate-binding protein [Elusimicrobiota bacterium]